MDQNACRGWPRAYSRTKAKKISSSQKNPQKNHQSIKYRGVISPPPTLMLFRVKTPSGSNRVTQTEIITLPPKTTKSIYEV